MINELIMDGLFQYDLLIVKNQEWENKIRSEFYQTVSLPRKKKKQKRKELLLLYGLQQHEKKILLTTI